MAEETVNPGELNTSEPTDEALRAVGLKGDDEGARAQADEQQTGEAPIPETPQEGQPSPQEAAALTALNTLLGKDFKSLPDAAKSYKELEGLFTTARQLGLSPEEAVERLRGEEPASASEEADTGETDYLASLADSPQATIAGTAQEVAVNVFQAMTIGHALWQDLVTRHPEAVEHEKAMVKALNANPNLIIDPDTKQPFDDMLDRLYRYVNPKAGSSESLDRARADEREKVRNQQQDTHVERGTGSGLAPSPSGDEKVVADILQHARPMPVRR